MFLKFIEPSLIPSARRLFISTSASKSENLLQMEFLLFETTKPKFPSIRTESATLFGFVKPADATFLIDSIHSSLLFE